MNTLRDEDASQLKSLLAELAQAAAGVQTTASIRDMAKTAFESAVRASAQAAPGTRLTHDRRLVHSEVLFVAAQERWASAELLLRKVLARIAGQSRAARPGRLFAAWELAIAERDARPLRSREHRQLDAAVGALAKAINSAEAALENRHRSTVVARDPAETRVARPRA